VYKTKLKENGDVDKYKAQLVTKNYKQVYGVNYKKLFHGYKTWYNKIDYYFGNSKLKAYLSVRYNIIFYELRL